MPISSIEDKPSLYCFYSLLLELFVLLLTDGNFIGIVLIGFLQQYS